MTFDPVLRDTHLSAFDPVDWSAPGRSIPGQRSSWNGKMTTAEQQVQLEQTKTTTKKDLIERIAADTNQSRADVKKTVQAFLDQVIGELGRGNRLEFRDFGVFEIRERAARVAQNPKTLEPVDVPPRKTVKFKSGRLMKHSVEGLTIEHDDSPASSE